MAWDSDSDSDSDYALSTESRAPFTSREFYPWERPPILWRMYDHRSQSQFCEEDGFIAAGARNPSFSKREIFSPESIASHIDWYNRQRTPFISFYDNEKAAMREPKLRFHAEHGIRYRRSVAIAQVRLPIDENQVCPVWINCRDEIDRMMNWFEGKREDNGQGKWPRIGRHEWLALNKVPRKHVWSLYRMQEDGSWGWESCLQEPT